MDGYGFLSLGASAGMVTSRVLARARTPVGVGSLLAALLPVLLSGSAVFLLPQLSASKGVGYFPLGLLLALLWQGNEMIIDVFDQPRPRRLPSFVFGCAMLVLTGLVLVMALFA